MYHINGYVYGNMPDLEDVCEGEEIVIYVFALANGIHDMQIYGQTFTFKNHRFVVMLFSLFSKATQYYFVNCRRLPDELLE